MTHACIAIQPNDKRVSQCARLLQAADMAGMQQIKAAVGEDDAAAVAFLAAKPQNRFLKCQDRGIQRFSMGAGKNKMISDKKVVYHAQEGRRARAVDSVVTQFERSGIEENS